MNTHQPILLTTIIVIPNVFVLRIQAMNLDDPMPNNQLECAPLFGTVLLLHDGWKTFTSSSVFSSSSFSTGATGGFKCCEYLLDTFITKVCTHIKPGWKWNYYVVVV